MNTITNCDPCSFFINDLTIAKLREKRPKPPPVPDDTEPRPIFADYDPAGTYDIVPLYNFEQDNRSIHEYFSSDNQFLNLRWERFKKDPPKKALKLQVFGHIPRPKSPVRPMILNGQPMAPHSTESYPVPTDVKSRQAIGFPKRNSNSGKSCRKAATQHN